MADQTPDPIDMIETALTAALQDSWDSYVGDTLEHPPDFTVHSERDGYILYAEFGSNFTRFAAEHLAAKGLQVVPIVDDATRGEVEARMDWLNRASRAIRLEVPEAVADDVAAGMHDARRLLAAYLWRTD